VDHDNRQSANGNVTQSSATTETQQPIIQPSATADVMPAYTYAPTWPGYAVLMSTVLYRCHVIFTSGKKHSEQKSSDFSDNRCTSDMTGHYFAYYFIKRL